MASDLVTGWWPLCRCGARWRSTVLQALLLGMILWSTPVLVDATIVDGRISAIGYLDEPLPSTEKPDPSTEMDLISRLSVDIRELGTPAWSVYYFGAMRGEVLDAGISSLKSRVYRSHINYEPGRTFLVQAGRIWVDAGVASSLLDGAQVRLRRSFGQLVAFAGTRGYLDPEGDTFNGWNQDGWNDSGLVSLFYRTPEWDGKVSLGGSWGRTMWAGREESERLGFLVTWRPHERTYFFYENRYELNQKVAYYQHLRLDYRLRTGLTSLIWNHRKGYHPAYEQSYIFQHFQYANWFSDAMGRPVDELRAHLFLQPESWRGWRVAVDLVELFPTGLDRGDGLDCWVGKGIFRLGYRGLRGYRGLQDGFFGSLSWQASPRTRLWLDLNRISYKFEYEGMPEVDLKRKFTVASRLGVDYSLPSGLWFSGVFEALDNPAAKYEIRVLARVIYRFHLESGPKEVR